MRTFDTVEVVLARRLETGSQGALSLELSYSNGGRSSRSWMSIFVSLIKTVAASALGLISSRSPFNELDFDFDSDDFLLDDGGLRTFQ
jgi:hypothetical protein